MGAGAYGRDLLTLILPDLVSTHPCHGFRVWYPALSELPLQEPLFTG